MGINIKIVKNGPALISEIESDIIRVEHETGQIDHDPNKKMKPICRCGKSKNNPFCDGGHREDS
jgi:CDGSH-type Zn-finger protein